MAKEYWVLNIYCKMVKQIREKEYKTMINPKIAFKMMEAKNKFTANHPKFIAFCKAVFSGGMPEGTIIEITVTRPGQEGITSNIKILKEDLELLDSLKDIAQK